MLRRELRAQRRYRVARAAAETLFDGGSGVLPSDLDALMADLEDFLFHAGFRTRFAIRGASALLQIYPLVTGRFRTFTALPPSARAEVLLALESSGSLGKAWAGLKLLLAILWFDEPAGAKLLPEQVRKTAPLEEPLDPLVTPLGPEGPLPAPRRLP